METHKVQYEKHFHPSLFKEKPMASLKLKGNPANTNGSLPAKGSIAPNFQLVDKTLATVSLETFAGKRKVLNIFPSIDTPTCATSVRTFNKHAASISNTVVLNISKDLPFAQGRFCATEGIENSLSLSAFRSTFAKDYGIELTDTPLTSLCARAVIVLDESNKVLHTELVRDIVEEPNYDQALQALK
jgi:thiol peroxidase